MPARSHETRERILDEAELLFARRGIQGTTTREIVEASGQRNASAVTYHFGSREALLLEVLARRGGPVDERRGEMRSRFTESPSAGEPPVGELVRCLVEPYVALLGDSGGRSYLRVVAQLRGRFAAWRVESDVATTKNLSSILDELERRPAASDAVAGERLVAMIMLLTATAAERARLLDEEQQLPISDAEFVDNLVAMCTGVLEAAATS